MTRDANVWQAAVTTYINNVSREFVKWDLNMQSLNSMVGMGRKFETLKTEVDKAVASHDELTQSLIKPNGLIDSL
jgi:hypothetical protein